MRISEILTEPDEDDLSPPHASDEDVARIQREIRRRMGVKSTVIWRRPREIRGSFSDSYLQSYGLRKSTVTGNWGGTKNQWDRFFDAHNMRENKLLNRLTPSVKKIADKHNVDVEYVKKQLKHGIKIELEHTNKKSVAREIALDHLNERPDYYVKLKKAKLEENFSEIFDLLTNSELDNSSISSLNEKWSKKYKQSIDCSNPKGFSQRAHCQARKARQAHRKTKSSSVSETVNYEVLDDSFEQTVQIGDYIYHAKGFSSSEDYISDPPYLMITVTDDQLVATPDPEHPSEIIASAKFSVNVSADNDDEFLESEETFVLPRYRGQGIAYSMYAYAKSLGNDIKPSAYQTDLGKEMWKRWDKDAKNLVGESASGYIPSDAEKNDWRFKSAITDDVHPNSIQQNAEKLGLGKISRAGIPKTAKTNGKI